MLSGDGANALADLVEAVDHAETPATVARSLASYTGQYGLTDALIGMPSLTGDGVSVAYEMWAFPETLLPSPPENVSEADHPNIPEIWRTGTVSIWPLLTARDETSISILELREKLARRGLTHGVSVPVVGTTGQTGGAVLLGARYEGDPICLAMLKLACLYACDRVISLQRTAVRQRYGLSEREFECMKWVSGGKTDWEIGQILSISNKTVNYHVENAKRKMKVPTRVQAVVAALLAGQNES